MALVRVFSDGQRKEPNLPQKRTGNHLADVIQQISVFASGNILAFLFFGSYRWKRKLQN